MTGVYVIRRVGTDDCYVGSSIDIERRWRGHVKDLTSGKHHSPYLQRVWSRHGHQAFEFTVLEQCERTVLVQREQHWIDSLKSVYNFARASHGPVGVPRSAETREKCRRANLGRSPSNRGVSPSPEQEARRLANQPSRKGVPNFKRRGVPMSAESSAKKRRAMLGYKWRPETLARRSAALKGKPTNRTGLRPFIVGFKIAVVKAIMRELRRETVV